MKVSKTESKMRMKPVELADDFTITSLKNQLILSITMELHVNVRSSDPNVALEIAQMKIEGVTIKQRLVIKEIINPPVDFILDVAKTLALAVAAQLIARKLWEILKDKEETELTIGSQPVQINIQMIEQQIINVLKEEEE